MWTSLEKYKQDNFTHYLKYGSSMTPLPHPEESLSPPSPSFHILHLYPPPPLTKKNKKNGWEGESMCYPRNQR